MKRAVRENGASFVKHRAPAPSFSGRRDKIRYVPVERSGFEKQICTLSIESPSFMADTKTRGMMP